MNVKLIGLASGEQLMVTVIGEDGVKIQIKDPAVLLPAGQGRLAIVPWLPYGETENMTVEKSKITFTIPPKTDLLNEYNAQFGSGLVVPPQKEIATPKLVLSE